jgi:hypothetical protein
LRGEHARFIVGLATAGPVAARQQTDLASALLQRAREPQDHRRLAGAAGADVADTEHGHARAARAQQSAFIQAGAQSGGQRKTPRGQAQEFQHSTALRQSIFDAPIRGSLRQDRS